MRKHIAALLLGMALPLPTAAREADEVDVSAARGRLRVLGDGKKHYLVVDPEKLDDELYFYGDGKRFFALRIGGGGGEQDATGKWKNREVVFWEPRVPAPYQAAVRYEDGRYEVRCQERKTTLTPMPEAESRSIIAAAAFLKPRWKRQAYSLARDDHGRYYYVDRMREPPGNQNFRLFVGPKGNLKLQRMTNVVSDSEGDIFATRSGELRLILNKNELFWIAGKSRLPLVHVPVQDNHVMIYSDLGVYAGERLGTPCDDL